MMFHDQTPAREMVSNSDFSCVLMRIFIYVYICLYPLEHHKRIDVDGEDVKAKMALGFSQDLQMQMRHIVPLFEELVSISIFGGSTVGNRPENM